MEELDKQTRKQILDRNIGQLQVQKYDLEVAISVNNSVGADPSDTEQLKDRLVEINKKLEAYQDKLKELE